LINHSGDTPTVMPTINLPDDELVAVKAAIRGVIEGDKFPHAPRLDPLRAALGKFEAAMADGPAEIFDDLRTKLILFVFTPHIG
jgi:hypothetical protein